MRDKKYWTTKLSGERKECRFPTAFPNDLEPIGSAEKSDHTMADPLVAKLAAVCPDDRSLFVVLTAAVFTQLRFLLEETSLCLTTCIERDREIAGNISVLLPLIADFRQAAHFRALLHLTRQIYEEAQENADYPVQYLWNNTERQADRHAMTAEIAVRLQNIHNPHWPALEKGPELAFCFHRTGNGIFCHIEYNTGKYHHKDIGRLFNCFQHVLSCCLEAPDNNLDLLDLLPPEDRQLWKKINDTRTGYPACASIFFIFEQVAEKFPGKIAVKYGHLHVTYRKLNEMADLLAARLMARGISLNSPVAVLQQAGIGYIVSILAILKAGAVYIPLAPADPIQRINDLLDDICPAMILTSRKTLEENGIDPETMLTGKKKTPILFLEDNETLPVVPQQTPRPFDLAYILFTSGSTGRPKGVLVSHRNVLRLVCNCNYLDLSPDMQLLMTGSLTFDATTFEIWGCLLNGGTLILEDKQLLLHFDRLADTLAMHQINTLWLTTAFFHLLAQYSHRNVFASLRQMIVGGEIMLPKHLNSVHAKNKGLVIVNGYGPTENTTFSLTMPVEREYRHSVPIGQPINNATAYILGRNGRLRPVGSWGILYVGGDGLFRGYLNNPALTQERLIPDPFGSGVGGCLYETGDIVRLLPDGNMDFKGRKDDQVKIRGYRITLGEIEQQLLALDGINDCVVLAKEAGDEKILVAYYVGNYSSGPEAIKEVLSTRLPDYMVPLHYCRVDNFPLTMNGKLDKKELPEIPVTRVADHEIPSDELELQLLEIWSGILQRDKGQLGTSTNFFDAGGHSLKASVLINRVKQVFNADLTIKDVFSGPTIHQLAVCIRQKTAIEVII